MEKTSKFPIPKPVIDTIDYLSENDESRLESPPFAPYDFNFSLDFLKQYEGNNATFESYRREIERLIQWSWLIQKKSLLDLNRHDIEDYIKFCLKPPRSWIGTKRTPRFITRNGKREANSEWRPFVVSVSKHEHKEGIKPNKVDYHLSQKAIQEIFTVLSSFYNYQMLEDKISVNPVALIRQKSKYLQRRQKQAQVMRLSEKQWQTCLDVAKEMADREPDKHERTLFILAALYLLYLRISELVASQRWTPQMGHFYKDGGNHWWFKTVGKGNKLRDIAVSDDMLEALKKYRESMDLSPLPSPNEKTVLLPKEKGKGPMTSTRHIRRLVQLCFDKTIDKLKSAGFSEEANSLEVATVHWLRHTGISDDINKRHRPVAHVRDDAGHSTSAITDRYNDIELTERHESAKNKKLESAG